jgi:hypothetical protein
MKYLMLVFLTIFSTSFSVPSLASLIFINEIHYDNAGSDSHEFVEVVGTAGIDLSGWSIILYNGKANSDGEFTAYKTVNFADISLTNQDSGFGFASLSLTGIQNGAPDGIALVNNINEVIQFLSYEGSFTASDGPATGIISEDIAIAEGSATPVDWSLQLFGNGSEYNDFSWHAAKHTSGNTNVGQLFNSPTDPTKPSPAKPDSTKVVEPSSMMLFSLAGLVLFYRKSNRLTLNDLI